MREEEVGFFHHDQSVTEDFFSLLLRVVGFFKRELHVMIFCLI